MHSKETFKKIFFTNSAVKETFESRFKDLKRLFFNSIHVINYTMFVFYILENFKRLRTISTALKKSYSIHQ